MLTVICNSPFATYSAFFWHGWNWINFWFSFQICIHVTTVGRILTKRLQVIDICLTMLIQLKNPGNYAVVLLVTLWTQYDFLVQQTRMHAGSKFMIKGKESFYAHQIVLTWDCLPVMKQRLSLASIYIWVFIIEQHCLLASTSWLLGKECRNSLTATLDLPSHCKAVRCTFLCTCIFGPLLPYTCRACDIMFHLYP